MGYSVLNNAKKNTAIDFNVQASKRWDDKVLSNILAPFSSADQAKIIASYKNKVHRIILNSQYRSLKYKLDSLTNNNETTVLNRIDYSVNINKGGINLNTSYETGIGRELRKNMCFLKLLPDKVCIRGSIIIKWCKRIERNLKWLSYRSGKLYKSVAANKYLYQSIYKFVYGYTCHKCFAIDKE
ncbi:MAG: hypothetical protein IPP29_03970 [Bacteroidetes bacterium]|nr:hypothetical protein [Bacteroidota bacterium]